MKSIIQFLATAIFYIYCSGVTAQSEFNQNYISIGVVVENLEESLNFYTEVIGMKQVGGFSINEDFGTRSGLSNGIPFDVTVLKLEEETSATEWKLLSFGKKANHPKQKFIQDDTGMQYITIFVNDLHPFVERLRKNDIRLLGETPTRLNDGRYFVLVQDPDGVFIELIGPMK